MFSVFKTVILDKYNMTCLCSQVVFNIIKFIYPYRILLKVNWNWIGDMREDQRGNMMGSGQSNFPKSALHEGYWKYLSWASTQKPQTEPEVSLAVQPQALHLSPLYKSQGETSKIPLPLESQSILTSVARGHWDIVPSYWTNGSFEGYKGLEGARSSARQVNYRNHHTVEQYWNAILEFYI